MKDMHDRIEVVHADPECVSRTFYMAWVKPYTILQIFFYPVGNSLDLGSGRALADDKKIGGPVQKSQVQFDDLFSFDIPDAVYDQLIQLIDVKIGLFLFVGFGLRIQDCVCYFCVFQGIIRFVVPEVKTLGYPSR